MKHRVEVMSWITSDEYNKEIEPELRAIAAIVTDIQTRYAKGEQVSDEEVDAINKRNEVALAKLQALIEKYENPLPQKGGRRRMYYRKSRANRKSRRAGTHKRRAGRR